MLKRTNAVASGVILLWYLIGAASGWKGWTPPATMPGAYSTGTGSGGHGSTFSGGWGGGK